MSDATITPLVPRIRTTVPRDCGSARVVELPARPAGRLIHPLGVVASPRAGDVDPYAHLHSFDPGPLARALMVMAAADAGPARDRNTSLAPGLSPRQTSYRADSGDDSE